MDCRVRRTTEWTIRCYHEAQLHSSNIFVNPTFETDPVTLSRRPFQLFFKSLRKAGYKFSYFGCGEYGENRSRPHGHIILFGIDFPDRYAWKRVRGNLYYRSPTLEKHWPNGHILFCEATRKNAMYTAGYTTKKLNGPKADEIDPETGLKHYERVHPETGEIFAVKPEFTMCSTKPAIGKTWLEENYREIYPADSVVMNGREYQVPRKYDEWLKVIDPKLYQTVMDTRAEWCQANRKTDAQLAYEGAARDAKMKQFVPERK